MLSPAHVGHLPSLRKLIRSAAAEGCFEPELAGKTFEVDLFFANLEQALRTGYFIERAADGTLLPRAAPGYVYLPAANDAFGTRVDLQPIGFGLFKAFAAGGYELWLTALEAGWRGIGHGHAMLSALLATPVGALAWTVRVLRSSASAAVMEHLLTSCRYEVVRETRMQRVFVRGDAPEGLAQRVREAPVILRLPSSDRAGARSASARRG